VVETKYDSTSGGWYCKEVVRSFKVGVCKYIRRGEAFFQDLLDMEWEMRRRLAFGMIGGVRLALEGNFYGIV